MNDTIRTLVKAAVNETIHALEEQRKAVQDARDELATAEEGLAELERAEKDLAEWLAAHPEAS